jgi:hypothetical protein
MDVDAEMGNARFNSRRERIKVVLCSMTILPIATNHIPCSCMFYYGKNDGSPPQTKTPYRQRRNSTSPFLKPSNHSLTHISPAASSVTRSLNYAQ